MTVYFSKQSELFRTESNNFTRKGRQFEVFNGKYDRFAVIEASAGTGKTFALVELVLEMVLEQELPLKSILLVTFTEKATAELRLRLRTKLYEILEACEKINSSFQKIPDGPYWEINSARKKQLKTALLDFDSVPIYTIHGFCKRVLQEFAFENRQLFEQQFCDTKLLFPEIFRCYIRKKLVSKNSPVSQLFSLYVKYTEGNLDTLESDIKVLLSKTGKYFPLLPKFENFIKEFTKTWKALINCDRNFRKQILRQHSVRTMFESAALSEVSKNKTFLNLELLLETLEEKNPNTTILENLLTVFQIELKTIVKPKFRTTLKSGEKWLSTEEFPEPERKWIAAVKDCEKLLQKYNFSGDTKKILKAWLTQQVLKDVHSVLEKTKLELGKFDFDDLLRMVEEQVVPSGGKRSISTPLTKEVRKKYACAIVDEFQDTDHRQWSIFRHLFLESTEHRLIVIGDPKQAIYSFRSADIFTYLQARKAIEEKTKRLPFKLKKNYRSSEKLISGLNQIFGKEPWFPKERGIIYQQVGCGKPELELKDETPNRNAIHLMELLPQFTVSGKKIADQRKAANPKITLEILDSLNALKGEKFFGEESFLKAIRLMFDFDLCETDQNNILNLFLDDRAENATCRFAEAIALEIKELLRIEFNKEDSPVWKDERKERHLSPQDICVLFRKNQEGETMGKALRKNGIDFAFYKQKGLFAGREAEEILDLLEAVAHPIDHSRTAKFLLTRFFGTNIWELGKFPKWNSDFLHQFKEWNSLAEARQFRKLFDDILLQTKVIERELLLSGDERSVTNYVHLFEILNKNALERHLDLFELILLLRRYIDGKEDPGENENLLRLESERNAVQLMTMHAAKGLEFPVVFLFGGLTGGKKYSIKFYHDSEEKPIIDMLSSTIPNEHQWQAEAEQQRLLYVAMTRACGRLYLPYVGSLTGKSGKRVCKVNEDYSLLNNQLASIKEQFATIVLNTTFSYSFVGKSSLSTQEDVNEVEREQLIKWAPIQLPQHPTILNDSIETIHFFNQLRYKKKGFVVSSFSRMNRKKEKLQEGENDFLGISPVEIHTGNDLVDRREDDETDILRFPWRVKLQSKTLKKLDRLQTDSNKDLLPGGIQTGNMLHELLELVDFTTIQKTNSPHEWLAYPPVNRLLNSSRERYGRSVETLPRIAEIIWNTLRIPLKLGSSAASPQMVLADSERYLRETDFYFPIPFKGQEKIGKTEETLKNSFGINHKVEGWKVEKGFLRGSIDFLFEHKGMIYLLDWKSNMLEDYHVKTLEHVVMQHYELQMQIYTLAVSYWFKLSNKEIYNKKFGGVIYIFLRGMSHNHNNCCDSQISVNDGVFFKKPSWQDLKGYEKRLSHENY